MTRKPPIEDDDIGDQRDHRGAAPTAVTGHRDNVVSLDLFRCAASVGPRRDVQQQPEPVRRPVEGYPDMSVVTHPLTGVLKYDRRVDYTYPDGRRSRPRVPLGSVPPQRFVDIVRAYHHVDALVSAGIDPRAGSMRFRDAAPTFLASRSELKSVANDRYRMEYLCAVVGDVQLTKFSSVVIERAMEQIKVTPVACGKKTKNRSEGTLYAYRSLFKSFFRWTHKMGLTTSNPAAGIVLKAPDNQRTRLLSPQECAAIGSHLHVISRQDALLLRLLAATGMRVGECCALEWADYDEVHALLYLHRTKSRRARTVPLSPEGQAVLQEMRALRRNRWVFPAARGDGHRSNPRKAFQKLLAAAGVDKGTWLHDFRRLVATYCARDPHSVIDDVRVALGHASVRTTQRYVVSSEQRVRDTVARSARVIYQMFDPQPMPAPESSAPTSAVVRPAREPHVIHCSQEKKGGRGMRKTNKG